MGRLGWTLTLALLLPHTAWARHDGAPADGSAAAAPPPAPSALMLAAADPSAGAPSPIVPAAPAAEAPPTPTLPDVEVVGSTPLQGSGVDRTKVPAQTNVLTGADLSRTGPANALRALDENVGSVSLNQAQNNPYQPNLIFRGFEASPLVGDAQGLAVYVNGTRFNQPFGDTTNFDLFPDIAIDRIDVEGSNPAFGLNALGGAVSIQLKNGFTYHGNQLELFGGSFGQIQGSFQSGQQFGNAAVYVAGTMANQDGWREHSPSQVRQFYGDIGWRGENSEVHLGILAADNVLVGNGTTPVELLAADRAAVFTYPDETRNKYFRATLSGSHDVSDTWSLQGNAYYSNLSQRTLNGDAGDIQVCDGDGTILCGDAGPLTDRNGTAIPNYIHNSPYATQYGFSQFDAGGPYSVLNTTATDTNGYGVSAQATNTGTVFDRPNHFVVGGSYDGGITQFTAGTALGGFSLDRGYFGPGFDIDSPDNDIEPVRVRTANNYYGLFVTDTLDVTPRLSLNAAARFNSAQIDLKDQLGEAITGQHSYNRLNPAAGLTYKILPNLSAYFSYAEANRAPTPAELSCSSPESPCSLTNFFVGDPDLKQVVAHTFEAGLRGTLRPFAEANVTWHAGVFRTDSDDDIQFVSSPTVGRAFFENVGSTRRQGVEAGLTFRRGPISAFLDYAYTDATFRDPLTLSSENNPFATDGVINVRPGNRLPGVPAHVLKFGAQYDVTPRWVVGFTGRASSGRYLFGDEANLDSKTDAFVVLNLNTSYHITKNVELFGLVQNLTDAKYETFGTYSPTGDVPIVQAPGAFNSRSLSPGAPVAGYGGLRITF